MIEIRNLKMCIRDSDNIRDMHGLSKARSKQVKAKDGEKTNGITEAVARYGLRRKGK